MKILSNKIVFTITIFLLVCGLLLSDPFLQQTFPGVTGGLLCMPIIALSFLDYRAYKHNFFTNASVLFCIIILIIFIRAGASGYVLFSNTFGTAVLGLAVFNFIYVDNIVKKSMFFFTIGCVILGLSFYLNLWKIDLNTQRSSFIGYNENTLSQIICTGISGIFYLYFTTQINKQKKRYKILIYLLIVPVLATISRTGIALLILTILINLYFTQQKDRKTTIVFIVGFILLAVGNWIIQFASQFGYIDQFSQRIAEAGDDNRIKFWQIGLKLARENFFTGVGFNNFFDDQWRKSVGLVSIGFNQETGELRYYATSIHNSFLDLILVGGIGLLLIYCSIIIGLINNSFKLFRFPHKEYKAAGAFILSTTLGIILFSYTGQAAFAKTTWYLFAVNYYIGYWYLRKRKKMSFLKQYHSENASNTLAAYANLEPGNIG